MRWESEKSNSWGGGAVFPILKKAGCRSAGRRERIRGMILTRQGVMLQERVFYYNNPFNKIKIIQVIAGQVSFDFVLRCRKWGSCTGDDEEGAVS